MRVSTRFLIPLALFALAVLVHAGALRNGFTNYDDDLLVTQNPLIDHADAASVARLFRTSSAVAGDWVPVTMLSYTVDRALWGQRPSGFHGTSLLFHGLGTVLLYLLLLAILGARESPGDARAAAVLAAALFAIHPVQVESVAWIAERKNVLGMAFFLAAFLAYLRATSGPGRRLLPAAACLVLFAASLLSKAQAVILPPLLLCYEWIERPRGAAPSRGRRSPLIAGAFLLALLAGWVKMRSLGVESTPRMTGTLQATLATAPVLVLGYVRDLLLPLNRSAILPRSVYASPWQAPPLLCGAILLAVTIAALRRRRDHPHAAFFWLWFLGGLALVLNFVPISVLAADRFQYWAAPGLFALAGLGAVRARAALRPALRAPAAGLALAAALLLCALTVARVPVWRSPFTLWRDTLRKVPASAVALNNLGEAYGAINRLEEAEDLFRAAVAADPRFNVATANLGWALVKRGYQADGVRLLEQSGAARPETLAMLAVAYGEAGRWKAARPLLDQALKLRPRDPALHVYLGNYHFAQGDEKAAMAEYARAMALGPRDATVWVQLGAQHFARGRTREAVEAFDRAVALDPADAKARANLGAAYLRLGDRAKAERELREAVRLAPRNATARSNVAVLLLSGGDIEGAERELDEALRIDPRNADATYNRACIAARRGDAGEAFRWLERLAALGFRNPAQLRADTDLAPLRGDPRFDALLRRMAPPAPE